MQLLMASARSQAYFGNILQKPMWDDDDFQTYFEGHFEMWEPGPQNPGRPSACPWENLIAFSYWRCIGLDYVHTGPFFDVLLGQMLGQVSTQSLLLSYDVPQYR